MGSSFLRDTIKVNLFVCTHGNDRKMFKIEIEQVNKRMVQGWSGEKYSWSNDEMYRNKNDDLEILVDHTEKATSWKIQGKESS